MKKIITILSLSALISSSLLADLARLEMGVGSWLNTASGEKTYTDNGANGVDTSLEEENSNLYIWTLIKHPIPIIPNLRLEYTNVSTKGVANGTFEDFTASNSPTQLEMLQYDIIPYYNLLDNTAWMTLDVGLDIKVMDISYKAENVSTLLSTSYSETNNFVLPLLYTRARVEIPGTNIGLETDVKFVSYNSSKVYDIRAKVDYTLEFIPVIQPAIEIGYRTQKYDIDDSDIDGKLNLDFSGFYAGAVIRF